MLETPQHKGSINGTLEGFCSSMENRFNQVSAQIEELNQRVAQFETVVQKAVEDLQTQFKTCLTQIEAKIKLNNDNLNQFIKKQRVSIPAIPECLPFRTIDDLLAFEKVDQEKYDSVVKYLTYLGGVNLTDSIARYCKSSLDLCQELLSHITWNGSTKFNQTALRNTKFATACEEAVAAKTNLLEKPTYAEFSVAMCKSLKSLKERLRRLQNNEVEQPARKRLRQKEYSDHEESGDEKQQLDQEEDPEEQRVTDGDTPSDQDIEDTLIFQESRELF